MARRIASRADALSRSPTWAERCAVEPWATQTAFLRCPPTASTGARTTNGNVIAPGTYPRARRRGRACPAITRTTLSSQRDAIPRSCVSRRSATSRSAARASASWITTGSPPRLPLVITSGRSTAASRRWCSGVDGSITPSVQPSGATDGATTAFGRRRRSTIGRAAELSATRSSNDSSHNAVAVCASRTMTAKGLAGRCFRSRNRSTAAAAVASHAR